MIAADRGHVTSADQLSMAGGSELLLRTTEKRWTCLHEAAQFGHVAVVRLLAERGGSELLVTADLRGWTSLHVASFWGMQKSSMFCSREAAPSFAAFTMSVEIQRCGAPSRTGTGAS